MAANEMETNRKAGIAVVNAMVACDLAALRDLVEKGARWNIPQSAKRAGLDNVIVGRENIAKMVSGAHAKHYKKLTTDILHVVCEDDFAVVLCRTNVAAHNSRNFDNLYCYYMRFRTGRVTEAWELADTAHAFENLVL